MRHFLTVIIVLAALFPAVEASGEGPFDKLNSDLTALGQDYRNLYLDTSSLARFGAALAGAGVLANSSVDREAQEYYRDDIRSNATGDISRVLKIPGEPLIAIPLLAGVRLAFPSDSSVGRWSQRTLRGLFVGAPAAYAVQMLAGGGRPEEGVDSSRWQGPYQNNNSLSGHTFIGAMPLITAAMMQENPFIKYALYAASPFTGLSRINDDKHYLSQVVIGWYLAYLSARAVERTGPSPGFSISAMPLGSDGVFILASRHF